VRDLISHAAAKAHYPYASEPDLRVCAQIYEACGREIRALEWLVVEMYNDRRSPGASPSWWVTVALQRFHSIDHKTTAARRDELKKAKQPKLVPGPAIAAAVETDDAARGAAELKRAIAAAAVAHKL